MISIDSFQVKLNKEVNSDGKPLPDLIAVVYSLNDQGNPDRAIYSTTIPEVNIVPFKILSIPVAGLKLMEGNAYALALGQAIMAVSRESGGYYRWICGKAGNATSLATLMDNGETKPMEYRWGTGWMQVSGEGAQTDLTHSSDHIGVRLGLPDVPNRYQVFTAPDRSSLLTDLRMSGAAYRAKDEDIYIESPVAMDGLIIYVTTPVRGILYIKDDLGNLLKEVKKFKAGGNFVNLKKTLLVRKVVLSIQGNIELMEIVAVGQSFA